MLEGTAFGRYRLIELLGRGGMGEVWRAHDTATDRTVAIKLLPAHFSDDEDFQRRFRREAQAAARLNTPHVVPIHDYGEIDGRLYVNMRLIEGRDLQTVLTDGPMDPARAVHIVGGVAKALHAAHEVGLLHRDVKPSNILLDRDDFAYLIDFGIARALDETRMTKSGNTIGTFQYIAPERLGGKEDARADIYSLACVLYECLTGTPPFGQLTMAELVVAHLQSAPPQPSATRPEVPEQIDQVIASGMAKDPDQRYATTIEFATAARDAITVPIPTPKPAPAPAPAPQPVPQQASVPVLPPTTPVQRPAPPIPVDAGHPAPPVPRHPPVEMPPHRPDTHVARPSQPSTRRKGVLIAAALAVAVVAALVVFGLTNIGNHPAPQTGQTGQTSQTGQTGQNALPDPATLLAQSAVTTRVLKSAHVVQAVAGKIEGLPVKALNADVTTSPTAAATGQWTLTFAGSDINANFVVVDGELYTDALAAGQWSDMGKASDVWDPTAILNPDLGLAKILSGFSSPKAVGRETINGLATVKITGQVSGDAVIAMLPKAAVSGPVPATAWIREDGDHELVRLTLEPSPGNSLQLTLYNWNAPVTVTKPPV